MVTQVMLGTSLSKIIDELMTFCFSVGASDISIKFTEGEDIEIKLYRTK